MKSKAIKDAAQKARSVRLGVEVRDKAIRVARAQGHSLAEIAAATDMSEDEVAAVCAT